MNYRKATFSLITRTAQKAKGTFVQIKRIQTKQTKLVDKRLFLLNIAYGYPAQTQIKLD